jgi:hypothetical protein
MPDASIGPAAWADNGRRHLLEYAAGNNSAGPSTANGRGQFCVSLCASCKPSHLVESLRFNGLAHISAGDWCRMRVGCSLHRQWFQHESKLFCHFRRARGAVNLLFCVTVSVTPPFETDPGVKAGLYSPHSSLFRIRSLTCCNSAR